MPDPKYRDIADQLRRRIQSGEYGPGTLIPGENHLMAQHGVARATARKALAVLAAEGLTEVQAGVGTRVRDFRLIRRRSPDRLASSQWGQGRPIWQVDLDDRPMETDSVVVELRPCPERVAVILDVEVGDDVVVRDRRYLVEGKPVMLATSYLPAEIAAGTQIAEEDTGPGGTYARLRDLGFGPRLFNEKVRSRMPLPDEAAALQLGAGTPVTLIVRTAFAEDGRVVEVNEMVLDASRYLLEWEFSA